MKTLSIDNVIIDNSENNANEFNNFFVSISHNVAKDITCNVNPLFYVNSVNDSIVVQYVSVAQVRNVITSLKDFSPGWDHLSPFVMTAMCGHRRVYELYVKNNKIHHYPTRNCDKYHIQTSTDSFSNARIWNVITTNIDVNIISFMQFKSVLKLYLHETEVILKYTK